MALVLKDRVKQTAAAPGTGTITLGATAAGFQSFASVGNGNTTYYAIVDPVSGDWEVNYGVYTSSGTTLTRNATPLSSSTGTLVNFTGTVDVFLTYPSEKAVWQDLSGVVAQQSFGAITATSAALTTGTITGAPVNATDIVNKEYADSIASGLNYHQPVNYASTAALPAYTYNNGSSGVGATITANANGALSLGGGSPTATQRVLVKDEVSGNAPYNGVYVVTQAGSAGTPFILTRASDYDTSGTGTNEIDQGDYVLVISGTLASTAWVQQTPLPITVGTTALTFLQFNAPITYTAGTGLNLSPATTFNISNTGVSASTYGSASAVPVFAVNAQGQITSVTNTNIAINGSQVSGNISGQAGSVANALTLGTYLTGGTYNGSAAVTATVDATSANTASKVVARDSSGNFSAGTITATLNGTATSTASATNLSGGAANQIAYQSAANTTAFATAPSASNQVLNWNGSAFTWSAGTISGVPLGSNLNSLTAGTYLTGTAYNGSAAQTWTVDATSANTASKVVARDASGNFSAGTITAALTGNVTGTASGNLPLSGGLVSGSILTETAASSWGVYSKTTGYSNESGIWFSSNVGELLLRNSAGSLVTRIAADGSYAYINNSNILLANNYNSYAPTLTGTGASGTWNINVTGSAGSAGSASSVPWTGVSAGTRTNYDLGFQPSGSGYSGFYFSKSTSSAGAADAGYFLIKGVSDNFGPYTAEGITLVSDANSLNLFARGSSLVAGGNAWVRMGTGTSETFRLMSDYSYSLNSSRAPIFYDANDTSYYVDPNSNSRLVNLGLGGVTPDVRLSVSGDAHISNYLYMGGTAGSAGSWSSRLLSSGGATTLNTSTFTVDRTGYGGGGSFSMDTSGNSYASASFRAPIFYDSNDTAYYVDPATASVLNTIYQVGVYTRNAAGVGYLSGNYSSCETSSTTGAIYTIGGSYYPTSTSFNTMYGIGYCYADGISVGISGASQWGMYVNASGANNVWLGGYTGSVISTGEHRGTIFYDYSNTSYYCDPNSTSNLANTYIAGHYYSSYNSTNPIIRVSGASSAGLLLQDNSSAYMLQLYGVGNTYGFLSSAWGSWDLRKINGGSLYLNNESTYYYGSSETYMNRVYGVTDIRSPIYYDLNNTGYYLDLNGTSNASMNCYGAWFFTSNFNTGSGSGAPLQAYSSGGSGAVMSFHRGGYYAVNFGLDSDNVMRIGGWSAAANLFQMDMSGNLTMAANVTAYSDETLKKDWVDMPSDFVPRLARVKSGTYTRIDNEMRQIGVGAQSLRPLMEEAVFENADGTLSVAYGNAAMASSVELAKYVTALEQRISQLEARI